MINLKNQRQLRIKTSASATMYVHIEVSTQWNKYNAILLIIYF